MTKRGGERAAEEPRAMAPVEKMSKILYGIHFPRCVPYWIIVQLFTTSNWWGIGIFLQHLHLKVLSYSRDITNKSRSREYIVYTGHLDLNSQHIKLAKSINQSNDLIGFKNTPCMYDLTESIEKNMDFCFHCPKH